MPIAFIPIPQPWPASLILHSQAITLTTARLLQHQSRARVWQVFLNARARLKTAMAARSFMIPTSLAKREQRNYHCLKTWVPIVNRLRPMPSAEQWRSSQIAGRLLNGRTYDEMPAKRKESQLPFSAGTLEIRY